MSKQEYCDVFFDVYEESVNKWIPTKFRALCVKDGNTNKTYKLFRVGVMAKVLARTVRTIRQWEAEEKIPKPRFSMESNSTNRIGQGEQRWYSEDQIRMISSHQRGILGDNPKSSKGGQNLNTDAFFQAVQEDWNIEDFDPDEYEYEFEEVATGKNDVQLQ